MIEQEPPAGTSLYQILGVAPDVDPRELAHAYRRLLRRLHPDTRSPEPGSPIPGAGHPDHDHAGPSRFQEPTLDAVQHAYHLLRDPARRARYDAHLAATQRRDAGHIVPRPDDTERNDRGSPGSETAEPGRRTAPGMPVSVPVRHHRPGPPDRWLLHAGPVRTHRPTGAETVDPHRA